MGYNIFLSLVKSVSFPRFDSFRAKDVIFFCCLHLEHSGFDSLTGFKFGTLKDVETGGIYK